MQGKGEREHVNSQNPSSAVHLAPQLITRKPQSKPLTWPPKCEIGCTAAPMPPSARPVSSCLELRAGPEPPGPACPSLCPSLCLEPPGLACPSLYHSSSCGPACQVSPSSFPQASQGRRVLPRQDAAEAAADVRSRRCSAPQGPSNTASPATVPCPTAVPAAFSNLPLTAGVAGTQEAQRCLLLRPSPASSQPVQPCPAVLAALLHARLC